MRSTFSILFYINRNKTKKNGKCPVMGRITVDGKVSQFSVKEDIDPSLWSVKEGCSKGKDKASKELNRKLDQCRENLRTQYDKFIGEEAYITVEKLKETLLKGNSQEAMLLAEFRTHNAEYFKSVGISKSKGSYYSYKHAYGVLEKFITQKYGLEDIALKELQYSFIEDFEFFLRVNLNFSGNTVFNIVIKLKYMVHRAIHKQIIRKNPFADFKCKPEETTRKWLSKADLVRILFIFAAFTGLAFVDLYNLRHKNISIDNNGITWIRIKRRKTGTASIVPMLDIPLEIYNRYKTAGINPEEIVFEVPNYNLILLYLKEVKLATKLKEISFHTARHIHSCY